MRRNRNVINIITVIYNLYDLCIWKIICIWCKSSLGNFKICCDGGAFTYNLDWNGCWRADLSRDSNLDYCRDCGNVLQELEIKDQNQKQKQNQRTKLKKKMKEK